MRNREFEEGLEKKINQLLMRTGFRIEREIKERTPVDTGRLRSSIHTEKDGDSVIVGTNVEYAPDVEFLYNQPKRPKTMWPAKAKRGGDGSTLPFFRPVIYRADEYFKKEIKKLK